MKKLKRFFRSACEPVPLWVLAFIVLLCPVFAAIAGSLNLSNLSCPELLEWMYDGSFTPDVKIGILAYSGATAGFFLIVLLLFFFGCIYSLSGLIEKRRKGVAAVRDNWITVYVDDDSYDRLQKMAADCNLSTSQFCAAVLASTEDGDLDGVLDEED